MTHVGFAAASAAEAWRMALARRALTHVARRIHPDLLAAHQPRLAQQQAANSTAFQIVTSLLGNNRSTQSDPSTMQNTVIPIATVSMYVRRSAVQRVETTRRSPLEQIGVVDKSTLPSSLSSSPWPTSSPEEAIENDLELVSHTVTRTRFPVSKFNGVDATFLTALENHSQWASLWQLCEKCGVDLDAVSAPMPAAAAPIVTAVLEEQDGSNTMSGRDNVAKIITARQDLDRYSELVSYVQRKAMGNQQHGNSGDGIFGGLFGVGDEPGKRERSHGGGGGRGSTKRDDDVFGRLIRSKISSVARGGKHQHDPQTW